MPGNALFLLCSVCLQFCSLSVAVLSPGIWKIELHQSCDGVSCV